MKKTTAFTPDGNRYLYDFKLCPAREGWAQLDTKQDAWYFGNWVNPLKLETMAYVEGDCTHVKYDTEAEFVAGLTEALTWHKGAGYDPKIDGMCRPEIIAAFERLGLKEWLH